VLLSDLDLEPGVGFFSTTPSHALRCARATPQRRDPVLGADVGRHDQLFERPRFEHGPHLKVPLEGRGCRPKILVECPKLRRRRTMPHPDQRVRQGPHDTFRPPAVDVRVSPVQVAQGFRHRVGPFLEDEPVVLTPRFFERDRESKFEWHVEPGRRGRPPVDSDSTQVVKRVPAATEKTDDPIQTASAARNFNCRSRNEAEGAEAGDEGDVHRLVAPIVGNVDERVVTGGPRGRPAWAAALIHQRGDTRSREGPDPGGSASAACQRGERRVRPDGRRETLFIRALAATRRPARAWVARDAEIPLP
jgi:hypothetical protein